MFNIILDNSISTFSVNFGSSYYWCRTRTNVCANSLLSLGSATDSGSSVSVSTSISFPIPVIVVLWSSYNISWFAQYLSSLFLNVLVVGAVMTESMF